MNKDAEKHVCGNVIVGSAMVLSQWPSCLLKLFHQFHSTHLEKIKIKQGHCLTDGQQPAQPPSTEAQDGKFQNKSKRAVNSSLGRNKINK